MNNGKIAFYPSDILLPANADLSKWAVVACDQFTSQPEYWQAVEDYVGEACSTLRLILPEAHLGAPDAEEKIQKINSTMEKYLEDGIFSTYEQSLIYIERTQSDGLIRHGIVGMIDLEQYEFKPGNTAQIRATEGTVISRIPPRVKVREHAAVELPHVMLLIDDPNKTVIEPLTEKVNTKAPIYDFDLMQGGGSIKGWLLNKEETDGVITSLENLCTAEEMERKYGMGQEAPMLFAVGDGNHSLATAKQCYENVKKDYPEEEWVNLPCRYALVEVVNNHDDALHFEPIHRVLFNVNPEDVIAELKNTYPEAFEGIGEGHVIKYAYEGEEGSITIPNPKMQLAVGTLQKFIDEYLEKKNSQIVDEKEKIEVDYIHGDDVTVELGSKPNNIGFLVPPMEKTQLFKTVIADGVLPRKTFSMGHAQDKRYYIEARKIR